MQVLSSGVRPSRLQVSAGLLRNGSTAPAALCTVICLCGACLSATAAPTTCAEVKASIEKRMQARGAAPAELLIVPRSLARGQRVVGTCEDGTQKIIQRAAAAPSAASGPGEASSAGSARQPLP